MGKPFFTKKLLAFMVLFFILLMSGVAGATHLVTDAYPVGAIQPTYFRFIFDGGAVVTSPPQEVAPGSNRAYHNLDGFTDGAHATQAWACNGPIFPDNCSDPVVLFNFTKGLPAVAVPVYSRPIINSQVYPVNQSLEPTRFVLSVDGGAAFDSPAVATAGGVWLNYDTSSLPQGNHTISITVHNVWGNSQPVNFAFVNGVPQAPPTIRVTDQ